MKFAIKNQKPILYENEILWLEPTLLKFKTGRNAKITIAKTIATTPPNLSGIDLKIA